MIRWSVGSGQLLAARQVARARCRPSGRTVWSPASSSGVGDCVAAERDKSIEDQSSGTIPARQCRAYARGSSVQIALPVRVAGTERQAPRSGQSCTWSGCPFALLIGPAVGRARQFARRRLGSLRPRWSSSTAPRLGCAWRAADGIQCRSPWVWARRIPPAQARSPMLVCVIRELWSQEATNVPPTVVSVWRTLGYDPVPPRATRRLTRRRRGRFRRAEHAQPPRGVPRAREERTPRSHRTRRFDGTAAMPTRAGGAE